MLESDISLSAAEFARFQRLIFSVAGISLSAEKKQLVHGRLKKRLHHHGLNSFEAYYRLLNEGRVPGEMQVAIDALTTNETYFFREPKHFDYLRELVQTEYKTKRPLRVWSAACSSGEEAYSIAMLLAEERGQSGWEVVASDLCTRVLNQAQSGHYPLERSRSIPETYLKRFCLKGIGPQAGNFVIGKEIRKLVKFQHLNLNHDLPELGSFDMIFLRNVMIYFNQETKRQVVGRLVNRLLPGGRLIVGHSETLQGLSEAVVQIRQTVYQKTV